jgi:ATP adenylyltransferase
MTLLSDNNSHKTAISRNTLSVPMVYLAKQELLKGNVLDYGCGKGQDAAELDIAAYDKYHAPNGADLSSGQYDTITCNYVLNVIPDDIERLDVIEDIKRLLTPEGVAYISVRADMESLKGWTKRETYQTYIEIDYPVQSKKSGSYVMYRITK